MAMNKSVGLEAKHSWESVSVSKASEKKKHLCPCSEEFTALLSLQVRACLSSTHAGKLSQSEGGGREKHQER